MESRSGKKDPGVFIALNPAVPTVEGPVGAEIRRELVANAADWF